MKLDKNVKNMMLKSIEEYDIILDSEIRNRSKEILKGKFTNNYIAEKNGDEIAFVAIDVNPESDCLVLYDLLVPLAKRHKGFGKLVLKEIEKKAINLGCKRILLNPEPFEGNYSKAELMLWYSLSGYEVVSSVTGEMEKIIDS